jgi:hypothetical protein
VVVLAGSVAVDPSDDEVLSGVGPKGERFVVARSAKGEVIVLRSAREPPVEHA